MNFNQVIYARVATTAKSCVSWRVELFTVQDNQLINITRYAGIHTGLPTNNVGIYIRDIDRTIDPCEKVVKLLAKSLKKQLLYSPM